LTGYQVVVEIPHGGRALVVGGGRCNVQRPGEAI
jgi:hypothetical protein